MVRLFAVFAAVGIAILTIVPPAIANWYNRIFWVWELYDRYD